MSLTYSDNNAPTLLRSVKDFFAWWRRELVAILPSPLKNGAGQSGRLLMISVDASQAVILHRTKRNWTECGKILLGDERDSQSVGRDVNALIRKVMRSNTPVILRLPARHGLKRILEFPLETEKNLRKILENQMGRVTPYRADEVYFDYRVLERATTRDKLKVELIASPRNVVDAARARLESWGLQAEFLDLGGPEEPAVHIIDLSDRSREREPVRARSRWIGVLALANLVLVAIVLGMPLIEKAELEAALREQVAALRTQANVAVKLRKDVERVMAETNYLRDRKKSSTRAIVVLNEATKVMPDGTWLEQIKLKNGVVQFYGFSPRAANLIAVTERSSMFQNVQFRAPVTQRGPNGTERFHLSADLATLALAPEVK